MIAGRHPDLEYVSLISLENDNHDDDDVHDDDNDHEDDGDASKFGVIDDFWHPSRPEKTLGE